MISLWIISITENSEGAVLNFWVPRSHLRCNLGILYHERELYPNRYGHWFTGSPIRAQASNEVLIYDSMLHSTGGSSFGL